MKRRDYIIIFIIVLIYNIFITRLSLDEIWNFGFSYNIANGLIPYRDFNMIITPLFPMVMALFLKVFANQLIIMHIVNSFLVVCIIYLINKICSYKSYLLFVLLLPISFVNYNLFCLFLLLLIVYCETNNKNDYFIGVLLALMILTKQNIGLFLLIPSIITYHNDKLLKRLIGLIIPIVIYTIYLIISNSLTDFLNYAVLGLFDFAGGNIGISIFIFIELLIVIFLIREILKNKNNLFLLYTLCFQIINFPIFDIYHFMIGLIPVLIYFLKDMKLLSNMVRVMTYFVIFLMLVCGLTSLNYKKIDYPNNTRTMKYRVIDKEVINQVDQISNYIKNNSSSTIYLFTDYSYLIKLEMNIKINKYDLINNGNLGYKGIDKLMTIIKNAKKGTIFILSKLELHSNQINKTVLNYIVKNMNETDEVGIFSIYTK